MQTQQRVPARAAVVRTRLTTPSQSNEALQAFFLRWFEQMRTGKIDRSLLSSEYSAHLSDEAVHGMSQHLTSYEFGASPIAVDVLRQHTTASQTFYLTKILFPRGDAASLLFGFNQDGKITGVSLMSMAGD
jgi:hypothetical protein